MAYKKGSVKSCWTWNPNFLVILTTDHLMQNEVSSWWMGEWLVNALPCQHDFYLVPMDHFIVDFILLHGFQLQLKRVLDYKSCSHLQTAYYSPLMSSKGQMKFWNLADIVIFGWYCYIWLILWNLLEIVKFAWNCEICLKLWNLVKIVKLGQIVNFGRSCEI